MCWRSIKSIECIGNSVLVVHVVRSVILTINNITALLHARKKAQSTCGQSVSFVQYGLDNEAVVPSLRVQCPITKNLLVFVHSAATRRIIPTTILQGYRCTWSINRINTSATIIWNKFPLPIFLTKYWTVPNTISGTRGGECRSICWRGGHIHTSVGRGGGGGGGCRGTEIPNSKTTQHHQQSNSQRFGSQAIALLVLTTANIFIDLQHVRFFVLLVCAVINIWCMWWKNSKTNRKKRRTKQRRQIIQMGFSCLLFGITSSVLFRFVVAFRTLSL